MKALLSVIFLLTSQLAFTQTLTVQGGVSRSSLNWTLFNGSKVYKEPITTASFGAGLEYAPHKYYSLSSSIGYVRKGGKQALVFTDPYGMPLQGEKATAAFDYITINTTLDIKYPASKKIYPFISMGPRLDFHFHNTAIVEDLNDHDEINKLVPGLITGAGVKYDMRKIQLGIRGTYLVNFIPIAEYNNANGTKAEVKDKTFLINLTVGFRL